jgi:hypothetical protein
MLNGGALRPNVCMSKELITPVRGLSRMIQLIASRNGGVAIGRMTSARTSVGAGRSVRSTSQASVPPRTRATAVAPAANCSVAPTRLQNCGSE